MFHPVAIVWVCELDVETYVEQGREVEAPKPACPGCGGRVQRWHGYRRHLRGDRDRLIWVPRVRCTGCGRTQALLPWFVVPWRWDEVEVIGRAVELAAQAWGHRRIAAELGRAESTVRGWLRRVRRLVAALSRWLLSLAASWGWQSWDLPLADLARLLAAVAAAVEQWQRRRGPARRWSVANLITGGGLLATNTSKPLARAPATAWMAVITNQEVPHGP